MDVDSVFGALQYGIGLQRRNDLDYRGAQWNSGQCRDKHVHLQGYRFQWCDGYTLFRYHDPVYYYSSYFSSYYSSYYYSYSPRDYFFRHTSRWRRIDLLQYFPHCYRWDYSL
jgi:hypothetical protein